MVLDPSRWTKRKLTKTKNFFKRLWTKLTVPDGTIYRIDKKMYQVYSGRYLLIGEVCHMCEDLNKIKATDLIT
jgi:hypothetical protein